MGKRWLDFVERVNSGATRGDHENNEFCSSLLQTEMRDVYYHVLTDYADVKRAWNSDELEDWQLQQCHLSEHAEKQQKEVTWAQADSRQYFEKETGMPIAPKNVKALHKRLAEKQMWLDAIEKENKGLKERGVYMTLPQLIAGGHVTSLIRPIPMRMLLDT
jgi:hypothetical protein